jgi:hypothetical protein
MLLLLVLRCRHVVWHVEHTNTCVNQCRRREFLQMCTCFWHADALCVSGNLTKLDVLSDLPEIKVGSSFVIYPFALR